MEDALFDKKTNANCILNEIEVIVNFVRNFNFPIKKSKILSNFENVKLKTITKALADESIINLYGYYIHRDMLSITSEDKEEITKYLDAITQDGYPHHSETLLTILLMKNKDLVERLHIDTQSRLFSILKTYFKDRYEFKRPYFAKKDVQIKTTKEILKEFVYENDIVQLSKISNFAKKNNIQINSMLELINSYNDEYLLANKQELWKIELLGIDDFKVEYIESILQKLCEKDGFFVFKGFDKYSIFPKINLPWNEWIFYSSIKKWSKSFKVFTTSNVFKRASVVVLKTDIQANNQHELLSYLSEKLKLSEIEFLRYAKSRRLID